MKKTLDSFYLSIEEPTKSTLLVLRDIIKNCDTQNITHQLKYGMPFFSYKGKMFCYLWTDKKTNEPYIGFVEGNRMDYPELEQGNRYSVKSSMKCRPKFCSFSFSFHKKRVHVAELCSFFFVSRKSKK